MNEEYLQQEKIEADDKSLGRAIIDRFVYLGLLTTLTVLLGSDLYQRVRFNSSNTVAIVAELGVLIVFIIGCIDYVTNRLSGLWRRIVYWRKLRLESRKSSQYA